MKNSVALTLFFIASANIILPSRVFQIETGETFALKSVNSEEAAYIESVMGCSLKCVDTCFQISKGIAAVQCTQQCGCKDLLTPTMTTQLYTDLAPQTDDRDIDTPISQKEDSADIEVERTHFDDSNEYHKEEGIIKADQNNKEFAYRKVSKIEYNRTEERTIGISLENWMPLLESLDKNPQTIITANTEGDTQHNYEAEFIIGNGEIQINYEQAKNISQIKNEVFIEDNQESNIEKVEFNNAENQENFTGSDASADPRNEIPISQGSGSVYKEKQINWDIIRAINIKQIQRQLSSCESNCSNFCKEVGSNKKSCMSTCNAKFCDKSSAKVITNKPNMKSFGMWGWIITIAVLGVAISMFLNKIAGGKPRKVKLNDFTESSANYKILV